MTRAIVFVIAVRHVEPRKAPTVAPQAIEHYVQSVIVLPAIASAALSPPMRRRGETGGTTVGHAFAFLALRASLVLV